MTSSGLPAWAHPYTETVLVFRGDQVVTVDLRLPLRADQRLAIEGLGIGPLLAVVTPCNPAGARSTTKQNVASVATMQTNLEATGILYVPTDGQSVDGRHVEPGFAIAADRDQAGALGRKWGQEAVFWFDGVCFWLLPAVAEGVPMRLPLS
jgi:hypothetical protein